MQVSLSDPLSLSDRSLPMGQNSHSRCHESSAGISAGSVCRGIGKLCSVNMVSLSCILLQFPTDHPLRLLIQSLRPLLLLERSSLCRKWHRSKQFISHYSAEKCHYISVCPRALWTGLCCDNWNDCRDGLRCSCLQGRNPAL